MNRSATSKELLLKTATEIAYHEGISKLSIRRVAAESGIAIGTVYNYYPAKSDLILAVMEDFWRRVFHRSRFDVESCDFLDSYKQVFYSLKENLAAFEHSFLKDADSLSRMDSIKGKEMEQMYLSHMKEGMHRILLRDMAVRNDAFSDNFTSKALIDFSFSNLISLLRSGEEDCEYVLLVLRKLAYITG